MIKPRAERVTSFMPRREVIYRCSECNTSFAMLGDKIKYCYNCGEQVDWNVLKYLSKDLGQLKNNLHNKDVSDEEFEDALIKELNRVQLGG